jgi:hypothetical protein
MELLTLIFETLLSFNALLPTFEFVHRLLVKQSLSHVTKRCIVNIQNTLMSASRCTNLLLWPVCFVRHVVVDRFRVDRASRNEENWLRLNERLVRSRVEVHVTVCGVKYCPRLLNCPRKKNLISIFLNILCQTAKKFALSRVFYFVGWGRALRGAATKSLSPICPRNICRQQIGHNDPCM